MRMFFILLLNLFLLSCAEPKYVNETNANSQKSTAQENQADCSTQFRTSQICLMWYWEQKPTDEAMGSFIFKTFRLNTFDHTAVEVDAAIMPQVLLWMPSMGHGSVPTRTQKLDVGTYRVENVFFIMPGEWQIKFQIKNHDVVQDEAVVNYTF